MGSLGFGLERIGILVLRAPLVSTFILLGAIALAAATIPGLRFDGRVVEIVDRSSISYEHFRNQAANFRDASKDVAVIVRGIDLKKSNQLELVRDLHLELALADGVDQVVSVFSLGDFTGPNGTFEPFLPDGFDDDIHSSEAISQLIQSAPSAGLLFAPEENAVLVLTSLEAKSELSEEELQLQINTLKQKVDEVLPAGLETMFAGLPAVRAALVNTITTDQRRLTLIGIIFGAILSFAVFGNITSAAICTLPSVVAVVWLLALFSASGTKLNFITTVLPTLALIIAFADSVVLYFRWQMLNGESTDQLDNLKRAILRIGPASALTSITTALAFFSFTFTSSEAMQTFALFGVAAVTVAFLAVITGLPLACYWAIRFGAKTKKPREKFAAFGDLLTGTLRVRPYFVVAGSIVLLAILIGGHVLLKPSYELTNNLPYGSEIRFAQNYLNRNFGGTNRFFVLVPVAPNSSFTHVQNRERIAAIDDALSQFLGARQVVSLGSTWRQVDSERAEMIARNIEEVDPPVRARFMSRDGRTMLVTVTTSSGQDTRVDAKTVQDIREVLEKIGRSDDITITGLRVLIAEEFPKLINQLRQGLLIAVFFAVGIVILATRDWRLGLATLVPNLLPILFAESMILVTGSRLDITNVIALTIAFGIAIDNAVHLVNSYTAERNAGKQAEYAMQNAIREIGPALVVSTVILSTSAVITQFSPMPSVAALGRLLILTLILALACNMTILPAYIRLIARSGKSQ